MGCGPTRQSSGSQNPTLPEMKLGRLPTLGAPPEDDITHVAMSSPVIFISGPTQENLSHSLFSPFRVEVKKTVLLSSPKRKIVLKKKKNQLGSPNLLMSVRK